MARKSKLEPHFTKIYALRKEGNTNREIANLLNQEYDFNLEESQVRKFCKLREKRGIKPTQKDIVNLLKKDNGTEKNIDINRYEKKKIISTEKQEMEENINKEKSEKSVDKLDTIMKELDIKY